MVSFDTNIFVYATVSVPLAKTDRARDLLVRGMRMGSCILLLQTLAEFSSVGIREAGIEVTRSERRSTPGGRCCLCNAPRMRIFRRRSTR
jgi:predicted nucleic acid-binding protein